MFTSAQNGYAARKFDAMWQDRYGSRPGFAPPPRMQMPLSEAARLLGVPANYTRDDIIAAFRRAAKRAHPDVGGSAELFRKLVEARDRLLASIGTSAPAPQMPKFAPKGIRMRYTAVKLSGSRRIGHTKRLARA
jgi:hypothetical protein